MKVVEVKFDMLRLHESSCCWSWLGSGLVARGGGEFRGIIGQRLTCLISSAWKDKMKEGL